MPVFRLSWSVALAGVLHSLTAGLAPAEQAILPVVETDLTAALSTITAEDLKRRCSVLASDSLEGREAGARGGKAASAYLQTELKKLPVKPAGTQGWTQDFGQDWQNVLAILPGSDPARSADVIVLGAHYDHVGYGNESNSRGPFGLIHNGADDNASGVSVVLEVMEALTRLQPAPARSIVFGFWDAEEKGLYGSAHWAGAPTVARDRIKYVLNADMVGRLRHDQVVVMGWRSAPGLRLQLAEANRIPKLALSLEDNVSADSDHWTFYRASIPTLQFDTGKHDDYHRPSDDADKLNYEGMRRIAELITNLVVSAANAPALPTFRRECFSEQASSWRPPKTSPAPTIRLGVTWDVQQAKAGRVVVRRTSQDSPAAKLGLRPGDEIIRLGDWTPGNISEFRTTIQVAKSPISMTIRRPGEADDIELSGMLDGDPVRVGLAWHIDSAVPGCAIIWEVVPDSPASRAGVQVGDLLVRFNDERIADVDALNTMLKHAPGPLRLEVERSGQLQRLEVPVPTADPSPDAPRP